MKTMKYEDLFILREALGAIFKCEDYPVKGRLYLETDDRIILKTMAELMIDGNFYYIVDKFPKELFESEYNLSDVKNTTISTEDLPKYYSWEFIPNLNFDIVKGKKGYIYPDFNYSVNDGNYHGRFIPLLYDDQEICTIEVY